MLLILYYIWYLCYIIVQALIILPWVIVKVKKKVFKNYSYAHIRTGSIAIK